MRDLLAKLDSILNESALNANDPKGDYQAKRKALQDIQMNPSTSKDKDLKAELARRLASLEKEAKSSGVKEATTLQDLKKMPASEDPVIAKAIADKEKEEENTTKEEGFEIGDEFGISFSEDFEVAATIVDIVEDGIVIELDDTGINFLEENGFSFEEGELVNEEKQKGLDGKACWKGYKRMGTKMKGGKRVDNCVKVGEDLDEYFQFEFPKGKDRGPRDHGTDELERREKSFRKHELAKDGRDYKEKDKYGDTYKIKGPKGKLPEGEEGFSIEDMVMDQYRNGNEVWEIASNMGMSEDEVQDIINDSGQGMSEAEYQGRKVPLGKPMAGDVKKSKVYVKNPQGNVVKVNFGDKKMRIKKSNPNRRKSFRARHNCANPGPRHKARYWSCRAW
jgi:hypothetical protein